MTTRGLTLLTVMFVLACLAGPRVPAWAESAPGRLMDDELLERLNADPLDEFDRRLFAPEGEKAWPPERRPGQAGAPEEVDGPSNRPLPRELGPAGVPEETNPLLEIARQMRLVEGLIGQAESGPKTQDLENRIVAKLEELIKQARSRSQGDSPSPRSPKVAPRQPIRQPQPKPGAGRGKPNPKPAADSKTEPGKTEPAGARKPDMSTWQTIRERLWGELPPKAREQMLELPIEEFLPKYELLIEQYFQRLAEETETTNN